ncbi:MAG: hypothetical protein HYR85_28105 [Planctomycetes bacterium]|nr:hypothetical protein [Planctomycetota bacterium]MBI3848461.1 hypothetical protein [Planctomycetota bacterium]
MKIKSILLGAVVAASFSATSFAQPLCSPGWVDKQFAFAGAMGAYDSQVAVNSLAVYDDGTGPALFAAGILRVAGDVRVNDIARWDGIRWSRLGAGTNGTIEALTVLDDGSNPVLVAGGYFTHAGGTAAMSVARWNGTDWSPLGSGIDGMVSCLAQFDDGTGRKLYAGGHSQFVTGHPTVGFVERWDGSNWSTVTTFLSATQEAPAITMTPFSDAAGPALCVGGNFTSIGGVPALRIARWNGSSFASMSTGMSSTVTALANFDSGSGPSLYAGGQFFSAGGHLVNLIARWNGTDWEALGSGLDLPGHRRSVAGLVSFDDGSGPALYASGQFSDAGGIPVQNIARWNGTAWSALPGGVVSTGNRALAVFDDGSGPALFTGDYWVSRWRGGPWRAVGNGTRGYITALATLDDGSGPALYAGGTIMLDDGVSTQGIVRWDGHRFTPVGGGFEFPPIT